MTIGLSNYNDWGYIDLNSIDVSDNSLKYEKSNSTRLQILVILRIGCEFDGHALEKLSPPNTIHNIDIGFKQCIHMCFCAHAGALAL